MELRTTEKGFLRELSLEGLTGDEFDDLSRKAISGLNGFDYSVLVFGLGLDESEVVSGNDLGFVYQNGSLPDAGIKLFDIKGKNIQSKIALDSGEHLKKRIIVRTSKMHSGLKFPEGILEILEKRGYFLREGMFVLNERELSLVQQKRIAGFSESTINPWSPYDTRAPFEKPLTIPPIIMGKYDQIILEFNQIILGFNRPEIYLSYPNHLSYFGKRAAESFEDSLNLNF